ncbi:hypothetical protein [Longitalea luteola]|uniref:hypothetical protein n=1 Tax=Longitalea luteola TaxID=2812563 RepID=UPI001A96947E|nr:hypothetical protein [Longitalea luteola]
MARNNQSLERVRHDLQLEENLEQHKKGWMIQKIGWAILYIGLILAVAGIFGTGPVSYKTQVQNGNTIEYERFLRYEAETDMTFRLKDVTDSITLEIPQQYLQYVDVQSITPLPDRNRTINGVTTYFFHAGGTADIHCLLMAKKPGSITTTIKVNATPFTIAHQIYP